MSRIAGSLGDEPIDQVLGRSETEEQLQFHKGSLMISRNISLVLPVGFQATVEIHMRRFLESAMISSADVLSGSPPGITLIVRRGNYANPCMSLLTMYNVYVILEHFYDYFQDPSRNLNIVWLDGHARSELDHVWQIIFGTKPVHIRRLRMQGDTNNAVYNPILLTKDTMLVNTMSAIGDEGLGMYGWENEYAAEASSQNTSCLKDSTLVHFRDFVLERFGLQRAVTSTKRLTFLVRRDYRAHPRSSGLTDRTISDDQADAAYLHTLYPDHTVEIVAFEGMPFREQLMHLVSADVFVAVHGAGNIHVLFLPDLATFVEYIPKPFRQRKRFRFLAACLNVSYVARSCFVEGSRRLDGQSTPRGGRASKALIQVRLRPRL